MDSASTSNSGNHQTASLQRAQVSKKPSFSKKPVPTTSSGRLAAFKKLVRRSIRTLNQKNSHKYHQNCQRTRYSLEQQLQAISNRTKTQEHKFKQNTVVTSTKTPGKMNGEQTARNVPTTTGPVISHIPRLFAPTVGTPKTCVKPQFDAKKLTLTDTKAVKSTTSLTTKSIESNLMSKFSTPTTTAKPAGVFGSTKAPSSAAPAVSTTPSIRKNIFTKTPLASRLPVTPSTTSRLITKPDAKTPAARQPPAVVALNDKKLSRTVDCARTIKRRSVNYLKKNDSTKTPGRIPVRNVKQYPQTEVKKNVPRLAGQRDVNKTPSGKSTGKRLSLSNFKSHCLILTPSIMQHLFKSAAKSTSKGSQKAPTVVEEEEDEELIQVHSIKPTSLLKFILSEKTGGETASITEAPSAQEIDASGKQEEEKQESDKLDDTIVIQNETESEQPASVQMFVPDTQDQIPKQDFIIGDSLPDIIEDSVPFTEQAIDVEPIPSAQVTEEADQELDSKEQDDEPSPVEIQMDILTQTENSINEEVEIVSTPKQDSSVEKNNSQSQSEVIPETYQQEETVSEEIKKSEEPQIEETLAQEETNEVEEEQPVEPIVQTIPEPIVEEKTEEKIVNVVETVPEQVIQEQQVEEIVEVEPIAEKTAVINIETTSENENDAILDQEKSSQTDFDDSIEIESNYENDSQMEEQQAPEADSVDTAPAPIESVVESVQQNEDLDSTIQDQVQPEVTVEDPKQPAQSSPAKPAEPEVQPEIEKQDQEQVNDIVEEEEAVEEKPKAGKRGGARAKKTTTRGRPKKAETHVEEEENKENADCDPVEPEKPKRGRKPKKVDEVETCCKLATMEETTGRVLTRAQRAKLNQK